MKLEVNGRPFDFDPQGEAPTIWHFLRSRGAAVEHVVVAVNGDVVPRAQWASHELKEGDVVEVVHAVAGGQEAAGRDPAERAVGGAAAGWEAEDPLVIAGRSFRSRLMVGTGKYSSPEVMVAALEASGAEVVTVAIRYMDLDQPGGGSILQHLDLRRYTLLPNTAGATTAEQAIRMARLAREATGTNWIKLEVIGDPTTLWPDVAATVEAAKVLVKEGFVVLPYTSPDLVTALRLEDAGCATVMPLASLIGSGQGFIDWVSIRRIVERVQVPVVVDAGLGTPSDAALAMELGAAAVLINTAIARAQDPVRMAAAMRLGVLAGRQGFLAGPMRRRWEAEASSPTTGVIQARAAGS